MPVVQASRFERKGDEKPELSPVPGPFFRLSNLLVSSVRLASRSKPPGNVNVPLYFIDFLLEFTGLSTFPKYMGCGVGH